MSKKPKYDRYEEEARSTSFSLCIRCKHKFLGRAGCAAFPDGIPNEFSGGKTEHRQPYPCDNGIQFEELDR